MRGAGQDGVMRKYYLDHVRTIMILLLFPVHTFMIWNNFGTKFYIWGGESNMLSTAITVVNPWFMAVLFVIAGMCARYSLGKRTAREFVKERVSKLLIPLISGMLLLVPLQAFYARKFFFSYEGTLLEHYRFFFTHYTDLSGYDGGFTPGHLWFVLFLLIISLGSLILIKHVAYEKISSKTQKANLATILLLFLPVWLFYYVGNFGGFSLGKYFVLYLLGYYVLSNEQVLEKLDKYRKLVVSLFLLSQAALTVLYGTVSYYGDFLVNLVGWLGLLSCLTIGRKYLNHKTKASEFLSKASFGIYLLHQTILVAIGYYVLALDLNSIVVNMLIILFSSFLLTLIAYMVLRRIPVVKTLFAMK